jgi:hypothetical protein
MKIALFGTCRLASIRRHFDCTDFDDAISFVHSTKEIIQLMKFITKQVEIPETINQFCFRTGILNRQPVAYSNRFMTQFNEADLFVIEICAMKKYLFRGYYLHHLAVDERHGFYKKTPEHILQETVVRYQDRQEIKKDILEIMELVAPRKILMVSHINSAIEMDEHRPLFQRVYAAADRLVRRTFSFVAPPMPEENSTSHGTTIGSRAERIVLLRSMAQETGIAFFDPTIALSRYRQKRILQAEIPDMPPVHYTNFGNKVMGRLYAREIEKIMECP